MDCLSFHSVRQRLNGQKKRGKRGKVPLNIRIHCQWRGHFFFFFFFFFLFFPFSPSTYCQFFVSIRPNLLLLLHCSSRIEQRRVSRPLCVLTSQVFSCQLSNVINGHRDCCCCCCSVAGKPMSAVVSFFLRGPLIGAACDRKLCLWWHSLSPALSRVDIALLSELLLVLCPFSVQRWRQLQQQHHSQMLNANIHLLRIHLIGRIIQFELIKQQRQQKQLSYFSLSLASTWAQGFCWSVPHRTHRTL